MGKSQNTVTIYQNGIAAFERTVKVGEQPERISLPFQKKHIGDVAASLSILGKVEIVEAPNYNPTKERPALELDPKNCTSDLFTKLSGAKVTINLVGGAGNTTVKGRVTGYTTENQNVIGGVQTPHHFITVQKDDGSFQRVCLNTEVTGYTFDDKNVQSLIQKALDYNLEKINPESVYLNLSLKAKSPEDAVLKYAIPSPAFKLSYRLRQATKNGWTLTGFGVVDNNTDEDWTNFNVNCATGQPVTFETDIADIRIPTRQKINLVNDTAIGGVEVESGYNEQVAGLECAGGGARSMKSRSAAPMAFAAAAAPMMAAQSLDMAYSAAATVEDVGDSSFFCSAEPVTIPAKKSALVRILDQKLKDAASCLYYQPSKDTTRIMRALKLTNEATYTIGRGVCAIEQEGNHVGEAILTQCKPGETAMLCYAKETGVKAFCEVGVERSRCVSHSIAEGMMVSEFSKQRTTVYTFRNPTGESFKLLFDHARHLENSTPTCEGAEVESKLNGGTIRYSVSVPAKGDTDSVVTVTITENATQKTGIKANDFLSWMERNPTSPLLKSSSMADVVKLYSELQGCNKEIGTVTNKLASLKNEQDRIRKNVPIVSQSQTTESKNLVSTMTTRLMEADKEIVAIEQTTLPDLNAKQQSITQRIRDAVARCTASWSEK